ncbi:MAG: hypothetical protein LBI08_01960 [Methanomassiliicoccaceae archaeon]|nr:hypothetical protein [Methanomassiliicoccaceae archaeon]
MALRHAIPALVHRAELGLRPRVPAPRKLFYPFQIRHASTISLALYLTASANRGRIRKERHLPSTTAGV